jgi:hypothetical protein
VEAGDARFTLDAPERYAQHDPGQGVVPAHLLGALQGGAGAGGGDGVDVAIAVNGRIAAVTRTYRGTGANGAPVPQRIEAMLLPDTIRPGRNDVAVYEVLGEEGSRRLRPIPAA